nr:autotransporter domain-containing protein [uncultured Enterobacter sp.]
MKNKLYSGRLLALVPVCALFSQAALAWQQEYIVTDPQSNMSERYTWDSDHQPRYDDILEERIRSAQNTPGVTYNLPDDTPMDATSTMSVGWNFPLLKSLTTGPVAAWHYDSSAASMFNNASDSPANLQFTDPLWHASVSSVGWRLDSRFGAVRPWAQISYNQQFGENLWKAQSGLNRLSASNQYGNWMDVTLGADMLLNPHMAAYASLSQSENMVTGQNYLYSMGVSARF